MQEVLMKKIFVFQLLSLLVCLSAAARPGSARSTSVRSEASGSDFIVEPYLGYEIGYLTQTGVPEIKNSGINFGSRFGYKFMGVGIGLDYLMGSENSEQSGIKSDFKPTDFGLFLGYKFSFGINVYGSYFMSSKGKLQSSDNSADFEGTGLKFGIGWRLQSHLEINLETIMRTYTKYESTKLPSSLSGSSTGLSISLPLF